MNLQARVQRQDLCAAHAAPEETRAVFRLLIATERSVLAPAELLAPLGLQAPRCLHGTDCCGWHLCQQTKVFLGARLILSHQ